MIRDRFSKKKITYIVLVLLVLFVLILSFNVVLFEINTKPYVSENLRQENFEFLGSYYFSNEPDISGREFFGNEDAEITVIFYTDFNSEACKSFHEDIFTEFHEEYIATGQVRFYIKYYLSEEDYIEKKNNFIYAKALECFMQDQSQNKMDFYLDLYDTDESEIFKLGEKYGMPEEDLKSCIDTAQISSLYVDYIESEKFDIGVGVPTIYIGVDGNDNTIFRGVPSMTRISRTILNKKIIIGE